MVATLNQNLFCLPADLFDIIGSEGAQLSVDDHNLATGQTVTVRTQANLGDTTLNITALQWPLLAGTVLEFDGGNMPAVVEVTLSATAALGATSLNVSALTAPVNQFASARDSGVNLALAQRLIKGCTYGTSQVNLYCSARYETLDLLANARAQGSVNRWSSSLGARWVRRRRGQPAPQSIEDAADEAIEEMRRVQMGQLQIENIGTRTASWPFFSNISVDIGYDYRKIRVETPLSENTPVFYPQAVDWNSALWVEI